jgi:hypothetical protein
MPGYFSAIKVSFKNIDIKNIDMWIKPTSSIKQDNPSTYTSEDDLKIPDLTNYRSPRLGLEIDDVYQDFPKDGWWSRPCDPLLVESVTIPTIDWNHKKSTDRYDGGKTDRYDGGKTDKYDGGTLPVLNKSLASIDDNLKILSLDPKLTYYPNELAYELRLKNPGAAIKIGVATQNQVYLLYVPEKDELVHMIDTIGPVQIYYDNFETLLTECLTQWFHIQYVENANGLWFIFHNDFDTKDELNNVKIVEYFNQEENNSFYVELNQTINKFFINHLEYGEYYYKVFLNDRLINQYQLSRNIQPTILPTKEIEIKEENFETEIKEINEINEIKENKDIKETKENFEIEINENKEIKEIKENFEIENKENNQEKKKIPVLFKKTAEIKIKPKKSLVSNTIEPTKSEEIEPTKSEPIEPTKSEPIEPTKSEPTKSESMEHNKSETIEPTKIKFKPKKSKPIEPIGMTERIPIQSEVIESTKTEEVKKKIVFSKKKESPIVKIKEKIEEPKIKLNFRHSLVI